MSAHQYWPPTVSVCASKPVTSLRSSTVLPVSSVRGLPAPGTPAGISRPMVSVVESINVASTVPMSK